MTNYYTGYTYSADSPADINLLDLREVASQKLGIGPNPLGCFVDRLEATACRMRIKAGRQADVDAANRSIADAAALELVAARLREADQDDVNVGPELLKTFIDEAERHQLTVLGARYKSPARYTR